MPTNCLLKWTSHTHTHTHPYTGNMCAHAQTMYAWGNKSGKRLQLVDLFWWEMLANCSIIQKFYKDIYFPKKLGNKN
jgi:hypothetical protein